MQLLALCISAVLLLQVPADPKAGIEGVVIRADSGQPVPAARVTVTRQEGRSGPPAVSNETPPSMTSTDDNGKFVFQNLADGSYTLQVQGNGYVPQAYGQRYADGPGTPIVLATGQSAKDITVTLVPAGDISGRLRDSNGAPLVNVPVQLLRYAYNATGQRVYRSAGTVRTNDLGEYRIYWVTPGRYYLRAGSPATGADPFDAVMTNALLGNASASGNAVPPAMSSAFYPGVADVQDARPIDIQGGAELQAIDITLMSKPQTYKIRGRVIDSRTGQPAPNASVTPWPQMPGLEASGLNADAINMSSEFPNRHYNPQAGTFEIGNLAPGTYLVKASVMDAGASRASGSATVAISDSDVDGVAIAAFPPVAISGRLQIDGQLPQGTTVNRLGFVLISQSERGNGNSNFVQSRTKPDGTFQLNDVLPGDYRFRVQPTFDMYIKEARFEGLDILNTPIHFSGSASGTIDIVLANTSGRVSGIVTDGRSQPAPATRVILVPDRARERTEMYKLTSTDENGRFTFSAIPPGDYKVFSWEQIEEYAWYDPGLLAQSETKGRLVHVTESSTETIEVTLIPTGGAR